MEIITASDLTLDDIGKYYRYEYTVDQGKGEITLVNQGMLEIRNLHFLSDGRVEIFHPSGSQVFSANAEMKLYSHNLPTANN